MSSQGESTGDAPVDPPKSGSGDPRVGKLYGKYRILSLLGQGGMGTVYEGEDTTLLRKVAIKFLPVDKLTKSGVMERFMREAQVAGRLNHPNVISIHDVAQEGRDCYMVMERLEAISAGGRLKAKGAYHWLVATRIIADCCAALKVAHDAGIVHRVRSALSSSQGNQGLGYAEGNGWEFTEGHLMHVADVQTTGWCELVVMNNCRKALDA